jgi:hypothetical protein
MPAERSLSGAITGLTLFRGICDASLPMAAEIIEISIAAQAWR